MVKWGFFRSRYIFCYFRLFNNKFVDKWVLLDVKNWFVRVLEVMIEMIYFGSVIFNLCCVYVYIDI